MKLLIDTPPSWATICEQGWTTSVSPDGGLRVVVAPLVERSRADVRHILGRDVPPSARIGELVREPTSRAHHGWEMTTFAVGVFGTAGVEIEQRRIALYHVLWMAGAIMVVGSSDALARGRDVIERVMSSGRPHLWTDDPACVAEWFQMEPA